MTIAWDSNCFTYFIDALESNGLVSGLLKNEKLALVRIFFYVPGLPIAPTEVIQELRGIPDRYKSTNHLSWSNVFFDDSPVNDKLWVDNRISELVCHHSGESDCRILAEAEEKSAEFLLTCDQTFIDKLSDRTNVTIIKPSIFWESLNIPIGTNPIQVPTPSNPLFSQSWWRW